MGRRLRRHTGLIGIIVFLIAVAASMAVIIDGGDGTGNTSAPVTTPAFPYWESVGKTGGGSCVYLGNRFFLSAWHIWYYDFRTGNYPLTVDLGGTIYNIDNTSFVQLALDNGTTSDLMLFRVTNEPNVPSVTLGNIVTSIQSSGTQVWMMGYGRNRAVNPTYWDPDPIDPNIIWHVVSPPGTYSGYYWAAGNTKRWGTNNISGTDTLDPPYPYPTQAYYAVFNSNIGSNEAIAATGDSGGPVFCQVRKGITYYWRLAGINITRGTFGPAQPSSTAVYGNSTYFVDLSAYTINIVEGTIVLGDYTGNLAGIPVTFEIRNVGQTTALETHTVSLDPNGNYFFVTRRTGTFDLTAKAPHWLRQKLSLTTTENTEIVVNFTLINGDVNDDNTIGQVDLDNLTMLWGADNTTASADLNGDGAIDAADLNILVNNWNLTGQ